MKIFYVFCVLIIVVSSCATPTTQRDEVDLERVERERKIQEELILKSLLKAQKKINKTAYPILKHGTDLCGDKVSSTIGAFIATKYVFSRELQEASVRLYNNESKPKVIMVTPNSPADRAGIQVGDSIQAVAGKAIEDNKIGITKLIEDFRKEAAKNKSVVFKLEREGKTIYAEVESEMSCDYPVTVTAGDSINAFADGLQIVLTKGMMRFIESEEELALVIGHELAHNTMKHIKAKKTNFWLGALFDILAAGYGVDTQGVFSRMGAVAFSEEFEAEADYVGLYFVAKAGFDISEAPTFWRRMAAEHHQSTQDFFGATHPSTPERFVALENTVQEILKKKANNQPLKPNIKRNKVRSTF